MAIIPQANSKLAALGNPPPAGTYIARCIEVVDLMDQPRRKYQSEEIENIDVTRFVFGVEDKGEQYRVATRELKISGNSNSNMFRLIKGWLGKDPAAGLDTQDLLGQPAQLQIAEEQGSNGQTYRNIIAVSPVLAQLADSVPSVEAFAKGDEGDAIAPF